MLQQQLQTVACSGENPATVKKTTLRIIAAFGGVGFLMPGILAAVAGVLQWTSHTQLPATLSFYLCPPLLLLLGFDHAPMASVILGWFVVASVNALLYAIPGVFVGLLVSVWQSYR